MAEATRVRKDDPQTAVSDDAPYRLTVKDWTELNIRLSKIELYFKIMTGVLTLTLPSIFVLLAMHLHRGGERRGLYSHPAQRADKHSRGHALRGRAGNLHSHVFSGWRPCRCVERGL